MKTEPQVVRCPARFARQTPSHLRNIPFVEYVPADKWDKWAAVVIGIAVLIVVGLDGA